MKAPAGISLFLPVAFGLSAQTVTRSFGSVVFPGGTSATTPGVTRNFGSVVFPGGSPTTPTVRTAPPMVGVPVSGLRGTGRPVQPGNGQGNFHRNPSNNHQGRTNTLVYAYPVFVGNYDSSFVQSEPVALPPPQPAPMTMYSPEAPRPVIIQVLPDPGMRPPVNAYQAPPAEEPAREPEHYLLAFKDHTVYSAVAYWFDGDTLHYFTSGSVHNQASVSLLDRALTARLNKELGIDFHMPDAK